MACAKCSSRNAFPSSNSQLGRCAVKTCAQTSSGSATRTGELFRTAYQCPWWPLWTRTRQPSSPRMRGRWRGEPLLLRLRSRSHLRRSAGGWHSVGVAGRPAAGRQAQPGIESMTAARRQPGELMRRHRGARAVASFNAAAVPDTQKPLHGRANNAGVATGSRKRPASERVTVGRRLRLLHASPTHEPRHAANYGDGWHPLNAPRLKPAHAGLKHGTSPRTPPRTPPRHGWQDIQAGSTRYEAMR